MLFGKVENMYVGCALGLICHMLGFSGLTVWWLTSYDWIVFVVMMVFWLRGWRLLFQALGAAAACRGRANVWAGLGLASFVGVLGVCLLPGVQARSAGGDAKPGRLDLGKGKRLCRGVARVLTAWFFISLGLAHAFGKVPSGYPWWPIPGGVFYVLSLYAYCVFWVKA